MTEVLRSSKKTLLAVALLSVLAVAALASVPAVDAAPGSNCTYYSDASHTTVVGKFGTDCCNNRIAWGVKTQFSSCSTACFYCVPPPID